MCVYECVLIQVSLQALIFVLERRRERERKKEGKKKKKCVVEFVKVSYWV